MTGVLTLLVAVALFIGVVAILVIAIDPDRSTAVLYPQE